MKSNKLTILVYSCVRNCDMWSVFITLFKKYWSDCDYNLILLTDKDVPELSEKFDSVVELDGTWYAMIMEGIRRADTKYVSLWMDDYLLCDRVNNRDIEHYIQLADKYHAANIRLSGMELSEVRIFKDDESLVRVEPGTAYSFSTQVGIWNSEFLTKNIDPTWSAWDFERKGSIEVIDNDFPLLGSREYVFPYVEGVRRGKWMREGVNLCRRNGMALDFAKRPEMSDFEMAYIYFKGGVLGMNPTVIQRLQNLLSRIKRK